MMNWLQLLTPLKHGDLQPRLHNSLTNRSIFDTDYDRIIFSTPFRRLQDKTQVIPLPEYDFVHNRLTHSIEVSGVARSLGKTVGLKLLNKYPQLVNELNLTYHDFGTIAAAAALAHDIGNPPFGHSGEKAISDYFLNREGLQLKNLLTENEFNDLCNFEGNANGFKILTNPANGQQGGMRLSYPTLAAFTKYPKPGLPNAGLTGISSKKYGFFSSEINLFNDIATKLALMPKHLENCYYRHPLAFLVEAADDICYTIIDYEDGIRLGLIDFYTAEALLKNIAGDLFLLKTYATIGSTEEKTAYLRAVAIGNLVNELSEIFIANESSILNGKFDESLIDKSRYAGLIKQIKKQSFEQIYCSRQVIEIEAAGFEIIAGLLHNFISCLLHFKEKNSNNYRLEKYRQLIPESYFKPQATLYDGVIAICQFVAGLTDKHAIGLFKKLNGIELPIR
jgi:dGTPase